MRRIHLDAVGGIAGDMFVAAMLDALPELRDRVLADGAAVLPAGIGPIAVEDGESGSIRVLRFRLIGEKTHALSHVLGPARGHDDKPRGEAPSGNFTDMVTRIEAAKLHDGTARRAVAILTLLAEAEAAIHRVPVATVHFHEIADWDSLVDVVCAGSIAASLGDVCWSVSPLPLGGGLAHTAHGLLPVPAPATAALLEGFHWRDDGISGERVTPTGAAILRYLATPATAGAAGRLVASGTGAGMRRLAGMPNVLRALVFEEMDIIPGDAVAVIEFEVDDMTGEEIGIAGDRLRLVDGVLDLSVGQRLGKKGRPMSSFRLLARPEVTEQVATACFTETSTIGLRVREDRRLILERAAVSAGGVPLKQVRRPGGSTRKVESDALAGGSLAERRAMKRRAEESGND